MRVRAGRPGGQDVRAQVLGNVVEVYDQGRDQRGKPKAAGAWPGERPEDDDRGGGVGGLIKNPGRHERW
jgi:hypothetical protein